MKIAVITDNKREYTRDNCEAVFFSSKDRAYPELWSEFDAAFLLAPYGEYALENWTGHPHLRSVKSLTELDEYVSLILENLEIEKKFLVEYPDIEKLEKYHPFKSDIEQIYLTCLNGTHRIRKRTFGDNTVYYETLKIRRTGTVCHEYEQVIDAETYTELKKRQEEGRRPIVKSRYCFMYENQYFELDLYDFWDDKATLELELKSEKQLIKLPPEIKLIRDVSNDHRFKNHHLARIGYEDYKA